MHAKGRRMVFLAAVICLPVVGAVIYASRDVIYEEWLIWRLGSSNRETRGEAAARLGELKSHRAVPHLIAALRRNPEERVVDGPRMEQMGRRGSASIEWERYATPAAYALWQIGEPALPAVRAAFDSTPESAAESARFRQILASLLERETSVIRPVPRSSAGR